MAARPLLTSTVIQKDSHHPSPLCFLNPSQVTILAEASLAISSNNWHSNFSSPLVAQVQWLTRLTKGSQIH